MENSRTGNSIKNVQTGMSVQIINKIMALICRSFFIYYLNTEYLGINGLFTNVLSVLSFAELGIGAAIIYNMYQPVADNDTEKIKSLMSLYKKSYTIIGSVVFFLGLMVIPFLPYLISEVPDIKENISFIYFLFLFDTSISYFFTYKKSAITAHQKQSIINKIDSYFYLARSVIQIIFLVTTRDFVIYLLIQILCTFLENIIISKITDKMYPYLKDRNVTPLDKNETNIIFSNVKSLAIYQFGAVIMNGTDNILISSMIGVSIVGLCSNYTLILNSVKVVLSSGLGGFTASVGNLNTNASIGKKESIYKQMTLLYYFIYGFCSVAFIILIEPFISIWIGEKYILSLSISFTLALSFFIEGIRMPGYMFRTTLGLFERSRFTPYIGAISNLVLSILLGKKIGLMGIFLATSISQLISYFWIDPFLIYKYDFKKSSFNFYKRLIIYFLAFFGELTICLYLSSLFVGNKYLLFIYDLGVVILIPNSLNVILFRNTNEYKELKIRIMSFVNLILFKRTQGV